jgi:RNA polymerase sigma-70 factor (ECF subfamily)
MLPDPSALRRLFDRADAARWGIAPERFADAIAAATANGHDPETLHLPDLALAIACADGFAPAWDHFVLTHRPTLYRAADAIDRTGGAREAADALYGELFGLREKDGERRSLFRYYHGRSRLDTWLRAVLAQRHVDRVRAARKVEPLPDDDGHGALALRRTGPDPDAPRFTSVMQRALTSTISSLPARDRLRLRLYYARSLTLAAIGRLLGEHEATVSRHLARTRGLIRDRVEATLRDRHGFDVGAIAECFQRVMEDPGPLDLEQLVGAHGIGKFGARDRSKHGGT